MRPPFKRVSGVIAALLILTATVASAAAPTYTEEVTDYGRNRWRTHYTPTEPEYPLGKNTKPVWEVPLGLSRSQPLMIRRDYSGDGNIETRIFHTADDRLWALNGDMIPTPRSAGQSVANYRSQLRQEGFILWDSPVANLCQNTSLLAHDDLLSMKCAVVGPRKEARAFASSQAAYARGATPEQDVIYVGFGHPASVVATSAQTGKILGGYIIDHHGDRGIVGAPLVFADDTVVIGTTAGEAFIFKGLAKGAAIPRRLAIGGRISFSPMPVGETGFIIASDARVGSGLGVHGYMMAYNLRTSSTQEFSARWPAAVLTPSGIPGEAAIDAQTIYFADKHGRLYALRLDSGELLWCRQFPGLGPCTAGGNPAPAFINNGPGVDEDRVYFVFRNNQGPNQGTGHVVALNKATGHLVWQRPMAALGNTAPVPMG